LTKYIGLLRCVGLSEDEQIRKLKEVALKSILPNVTKKTIDALAAYGEKAIPAVTEIVQNSVIEDIRTYGLEAIEKIKRASKF